MSEWKTYKLGEIIELKRGYDLPEYNRVHGKFPVFTSSGFSSWHNGFKVKGPGVVTGRYGTLGEVFYTEKDYWPHNTTLYVRDFKGNDAKFIFYFLKTLRLASGNDKSSVPGLNRNDLHNFNVTIPDLPTQRQIAAILSSLDDKIELNLQMNQTLEAMAQAIFKEWFVSNSSVVLSEYIEINPKISIKKDESTIYVEMSDLSEFGSSVKSYVKRAFTSGSKFQNMDTLLARITPCLENGKTALVDFLGETEVAHGSTEFIVMRSKGFISPYYVYLLARDQSFREYAIKSMVGSSGRQRVQHEMLNSYELPEIDENKMMKFHQTVGKFFEKITTNTLQIRTLTQLRDTLLPKLMSGQIAIQV